MGPVRAQVFSGSLGGIVDESQHPLIGPGFAIEPAGEIRQVGIRDQYAIDARNARDVIRVGDTYRSFDHGNDQHVVVDRGAVLHSGVPALRRSTFGRPGRLPCCGAPPADTWRSEPRLAPSPPYPPWA